MELKIVEEHLDEKTAEENGRTADETECVSDSIVFVVEVEVVPIDALRMFGL